LEKKHILDNAACEVCGLREDSDHIILRCPFAAQVWAAQGIDTTTSIVRQLWIVARPASNGSGETHRLLHSAPLMHALETPQRHRFLWRPTINGALLEKLFPLRAAPEFHYRSNKITKS
jgi:hypothetical protein